MYVFMHVCMHARTRRRKQVKSGEANRSFQRIRDHAPHNISKTKYNQGRLYSTVGPRACQYLSVLNIHKLPWAPMLVGPLCLLGTLAIAHWAHALRYIYGMVYEDLVCLVSCVFVRTDKRNTCGIRLALSENYTAIY